MNETVLIFFVILLFQVILGEKKFENHQNDSNSVRCLLLKKHQDPCIVIGGEPVPQHLIREFQYLPSNVKNVIKSNGMVWNLTAEEYKYIPPNYWLLMPVERLSKLSGYNLSSILLAYPQESSLAANIILALQSREQRNSFLISLSMKKTLSYSVELIIAEGVSQWTLDRDWNFVREIFVGSPLIAYFPPYYFFSAPSSLITKFLFFFHSWDGVGNSEWLKKPKLIQRIWAHLFYENYHLRLSDWATIQVDRFQYFLPGMIPDELSELKRMKNISTTFNKIKLFKMNFSMQQTQLLFDIFYHDKKLTRKIFMDLSVVLTKLSPLQLQKFPVNFTNFKKIEILSIILDEKTDFITMKQITQLVIAELKLAGELDSTNISDWGSSIKYLGAYVYTLSLHEIRQLSNGPLDVFGLEGIESSKLSLAQIYYLTQNGTSLHGEQPSTTRSLKWMLRGLPASNIRNMDINNIGSKIWLTLLSNLPADNVPRSIAFLKHIIDLLYNIESISILERLFINPTMEDYFKLIPSNILKNVTRHISNNFSVLKRRYIHRVSRLPDNVFSLLLNENRDKSWLWNKSENGTISLKFLIRGLTCYDIEKLDVSEFIYVISQYNKELNELGRVFPKNLQHCCYDKLIQYLKMKSKIMQEDKNEGLIALLEPGDIEGVGGYVLAGLPTSVIEASTYSKQILTKIGKLSMPELLLAVDKQKMNQLINLALGVFRRGDELGNVELLQMGNLMLFLPADSLVNVKPSTLKLIVQLNYSDRRLCTDRKTRSLWSNIITKAFGEVDTWTEGVIVLLDDFLLVISDDKLDKINKSTWLKVAEPLNFRFGESVEWWKEDITFYEACMEVLDFSEHIYYTKEIEKLVKWQLKLAQWKLDTVRKADDFLSVFKKQGSHYNKFPPKFIHHFIKGSVSKTSNLVNGSKIENCAGNCNKEGNNNSSVTLIPHDPLSANNGSTIYYSTTTFSDRIIKVNPISSTEISESSMFSTNDDISTHEEQFTDVTDKNDETSIESLITNPNLFDSSTEFSHTTEKPRKKCSSGFNLFGLFGNDACEEETTVKSEANSITTNSPDVSSTYDSKDLGVTDVSTEINHQLENVNDDYSLNSSSSTVKSFVIPEVSTVLSTSVKGLMEDKIPPTFGNNSTSEETTPYSFVTNFTHFSSDELTTKSIENSTKALLNSPTDLIEETIKFLKPTESSVNEELTTRSGSEDYFDDEVNDDLIVNHTDAKLEEPVSRFMFDVHRLPDGRSKQYDLFDNISANDSFYDFDDIHPKIITKRNVDSNDKTVIHDTISCDALKVVGNNLHLIFNEEILNMMSIEEINDCFEVFGSMDLSYDLKEKIWKKTTNRDLHLMGSLLKAAKVSDVMKLNFSFDEPWLLESLYLLSKFTPSKEVIQKTIEKVVESNDIEAIDPESLASLYNLICYMESDTRKKIFSKTNDNSLALSMLSKVSTCSSGCIQDLAEFSMDVRNYGPPNKWDLYDVISLGVIPAGLKSDQWIKLIANNHFAIMGLQPSAVKCLSVENLLAIPAESFRLMPYKTMMIIFRERFTHLRQNQKFALHQILNPHINVTEQLLPIVNHEMPEVVNFSSRLHQSLLIVMFVAFCIYKFI